MLRRSLIPRRVEAVKEPEAAPGATGRLQGPGGPGVRQDVGTWTCHPLGGILGSRQDHSKQFFICRELYAEPRAQWPGTVCLGTPSLF